MSGFVVVAGLLTLFVLIALLFPLLRRREGSPEAWRSAGIAGLLLLVGAAALYPVWSNYDWNAPEPAADSPQAMVGRLARRLEREPDDLNGWLMLGRSYAVLGASDRNSPTGWHELSARAYQRADTLAKGQSPEALIGLAEALLETGRSEIGGRAGRLFEQALKLDETSTKAWFYSAFAALERNELPLARQRFERLLRANPPEQVVRIIEEQMRAIDAGMAMAAGAPGAGSALPAPTAAPATQSAAAAAVAIPLRITIAAAIASKATGGGRLFVIARRPGQQGVPPLGVKQIVQPKFPLDTELLSSDTMIPGAVAFSAGQELEIEARLSLSGDATSRSGDPFGVIRVKAGERTRTTIEISQLKP